MRLVVAALELKLLADGRFGRGPERGAVGLEGGGLELRELGRPAARVLGPAGQPIHMDPAATLDDLREAVTTLEELERTARRVLGGAHPTAMTIERSLRDEREELRARSY